MPEEVYNQIREFEIKIKKIIEEKYGKNISPEKIAVIDSKSYTDLVDTSNGIDPNKIESEIVRNMFNDCVDITSEKELDVEGTMREIPYAGNLQRGLVEYYTQELAREYNLQLDTIPELQNDVNMIIFSSQYRMLFCIDILGCFYFFYYIVTHFIWCYNSCGTS